MAKEQDTRERMSLADSLWYKDAIIYELHVRAFADSDGDGIGDFPGITSKLDYLADLGITAIWLLPFYPSPGKDDGYDIADYLTINPAYGTMEDFQRFLEEAHKRGLRVITELVINHTSDQHKWFKDARRAPPGSPLRDFYVWSDSAEKYKGARIIFKDFEHSNWSWDPVAGAYYWHRFYSHQPDLNFDNPAVRKAVTDVMDFWFGMGVDGLRLDAIPYLFEREGTSCENLPETHEVLRELRKHVDEHHSDKMLLAEANQWPEDAIAYFGTGDECHMSFHFPLMPRLFMATRMEDSYPIIDILRQTPPIPDTCQWATFLRNHDELTLEMVTDEERDYMYRVYAGDPQMRINLGIRRRLAPLLGNNRAMIELMNALLFSLPGAPVLYYGDEIGMGDNVYLSDRNGVRTPMQWGPDRNAGFSRANPQKLYLPAIIDPEYHYEALNVESQEQNSQSLLWWTRRLLALRRRFRAFSRGTIEFLLPENRKVLAFVRRWQDETILVVANLSRFPQSAELDLSAFRGRVPVEVFGLSQFHAVGEGPYTITLGPYGFYWFQLQEGKAETMTREQGVLPMVEHLRAPEQVLADAQRPTLERILQRYLRPRRWFGGKARSIRHVQVQDIIVAHTAQIALLTVEYADGDPETYVLPLAFASGPAGALVVEQMPHAAILRTRISSTGEEWVVYDAFYDRSFQREILEMLAGGTRLTGELGNLTPVSSPALADLLSHQSTLLEPTLGKGEQSNSSVAYSNQLMFKLYRKVEAGAHPEVEMGRVLSGRFEQAPAMLGHLEYRRRGLPPTVLGVLSRYVENQGNGWDFTIDALSRFFSAALAAGNPPAAPGNVVALLESTIPENAQELVGPYLEHVRLLGQRTAEMHLALAGEPDDPSFALEAFTDFSRRSLYHALVGVADRSLGLLAKKQRELPEDSRELAARVLSSATQIRSRFAALRDRQVAAVRMRGHGDYHLSQVLWTGKDWMLIDFEGEPARAISERRIKRSALRDVAGMLRSFHYAAFAASYGDVPGVVTRPPQLEGWAKFWQAWVSRSFLGGYLDRTRGAGLFSEDVTDIGILLDAFLLEKAAYEIAYELNNRPAWVKIPLSGILDLITDGATTEASHEPPR